MSKRLALCSISLTCLFHASVQSKESTDIYSFSLEELLNVPVAIASRNDKSLTQAPSSVSLFTREDIQRLGLRTLGDLLTRVPGFYSMMDSVEGNLSHMVMRGHSQNYANTLLVLLNGQRINDDYTGGINYLIRYFSIQNASKVEVIRGPGSALYGSNAYSGVVNIITDSLPEWKATVGNLSTAAVYWSQQLATDDWLFGASMNLYRDAGDTFNDVFDASGLQTTTSDPKQVQQINLSAKSERSRLDFQYLHSKRENYYLFRRLRDDVAELDLTHLSINGSYQLLEGEQWSVEASAGFQHAKRESLSALVAKGAAPFDAADLLFGVDFEYQSANIAVDGIYHYSDNLSFNLGAFISDSQIPRAYLKSNYAILTDERYLGQVQTFDQSEADRTVLDNNRHIHSVYAQSEWQVQDNISLTAGLRYDSYNDIDSATTPRLSWVHALNEQQGYKVIYAEAYRAPSLGDLYDEESGLTVGNMSLKANELSSIELVYYWNTDNTAMTATLFENKHENIVGRFNTIELSFLANIGNNRARGLEWQWQWQPTEQWLLQTDITHLFKNRTDFIEGAGLSPSEFISPKTYLNYEVHYAASNWSLGFSGNWRAKVPSLSSPASLLLVNAQYRYSISPEMSWELNVKNLSDKQYATSSYSLLGITATGQNVQELPARGRQLSLSFHYQF
ncbi:TonB-dependent receptor plug domain-containing protein [Paraglaciecola aestuariivivens]